jgi:ribosomal protein S18 acetylase RimI-like enzyme
MKKIISIEKINLRDCLSTDLGFVYDLMKLNMEEYVKEFWGEWNSEKFKASLKKENIEIINYDNEKIGFFDITRDDSKSYLHNIQLVPSFQGQGIGARIMSLIEKQEKLAGTEIIEAKVFKTNPARFFYHKLGYKTIKEEKDSLIIGKSL